MRPRGVPETARTFMQAVSPGAECGDTTLVRTLHMLFGSMLGVYSRLKLKKFPSLLRKSAWQADHILEASGHPDRPEHCASSPSFTARLYTHRAPPAETVFRAISANGNGTMTAAEVAYIIVTSASFYRYG